MPDRTLRIMISSRCNDRFPAQGERLSSLRQRIKDDLEAERLLGRRMFEVWTNETAPPDDAAGDSVEVCMAQIDQADIVISLSNGNAGWAVRDTDIGICHAELMRGLGSAAGKVRLISLGDQPDDPDDPAQAHRNQRFREYLATQNLFRGGTVRTADEAVARVREAAFDAVQTLARLGLREARKGRYHTGEALAWSSLGYLERRRAMTDTLAGSLGGTRSNSDTGQVTVDIDGTPVLFVVHAVPAAMSIPRAREMVGQPFLRDHELVGSLGGSAGPVHVIACARSATETQAIAMLGSPDATVVSAPFGIYVADPVQMVQFAFIRDCRDATTTRFGAQRLLDWLEQSGESGAMVTRATSRARIVAAIAGEQDT